MSEPVSGFVALLFGLFLGDPGDGAGIVKPQPKPALAPTSVICLMEISSENGRQDFVVRITAPNKELSGRYVLKLDGRGNSKVTVRDERSLTLRRGETKVLSHLNLDAGVHLTGHIVLKDAGGAILCQDTL